MEDMEKKVLWTDGESVILKREDVEDYLYWTLQYVIDSGDYDESDIDYYRNQNCLTLNELKKVKDEYVGLSICVMNNSYMIDQQLMRDWLRG